MKPDTPQQNESQNANHEVADDSSRSILIAQVVIVIALLAVIPLALVLYQQGRLAPTQPTRQPTPLTGFSVIPQVQLPPLACPNGNTSDVPIAQAVLASDCAALISMLPTLGGEETLNWGHDVPINDWAGVGLGGEPVRVVVLDLTATELSGQVPQQIENLSGLQALHLFGNRLSGGIPPQLGRLPHLITLDLGENHLTGPIPATLGDLSSLTSLDVGDNNLSGELPPQLENLSALEWLVISGNDLTGNVTPLLEQLRGLTYLNIHDTQLSGCIPDHLRRVDGFLGGLNLCSDQ